MDQSLNWLQNSDSRETESTRTLLLGSSDTVDLAILTSSRDRARELSSCAEQTGLARVREAITVDRVTEEGESISSLVADQPDAVVIDIDASDHAITALRVLRNVLPKTALLFCCETSNPELLMTAMQAGAQEFIPRPLSGIEIHGALNRLTESLQKRQSPASPKGRILSVISAKGGTGATLISINLAFGISKLVDSSVALIDLDHPMGDAAGYLGLTSEFTLLDALADTQRLDPVLLDSYMVHRNGVAILPGMRDSRPRLIPSAEGLSELFEVLKKGYSRTVIDFSAPVDEARLKEAVRASSDLIVVITPELPCLWRTDWLIHLLISLGAKDKLRLVVNRSSRNDEIRIKQVEDSLGHPVYWNIPNDYGSAVGSINSATPLVSNGRSVLAESYAGLASKLEGVPWVRKKRALTSLISFQLTN